jgi:hypothetical protein
MDYFGKKNKDVNILRTCLFIMAGLFAFLFTLREFINYKEKRALTTETWAISPENGFVLKMNKIPITIEERNSEYRAHVRDFLTHWYQFDQYTFIENTNYASNLIDKKSREIEINKYREENTLAKLQESDIILSVIIKDIKVDATQRPYKGTFQLEQTLRTSLNLNRRIIEGTFNIEDSEGRSYSNPHAALITNYQITRKENLTN